MSGSWWSDYKRKKYFLVVSVRGKRKEQHEFGSRVPANMLARERRAAGWAVSLFVRGVSGRGSWKAVTKFKETPL